MNDVRMIQRPLQDKNYEYNGFDPKSNEIMGGQNLLKASIDESNSGNHSEDQKPTRPESNNPMNWKDTFIAMARNENPYTKQQKEPEWDGSEVPQIVNSTNGKVTVVGTDGKAFSYRDERSYKLANTANRIAEKLSSSGKAIEKRAFSGFRMPALQKPRIDNNCSGKGKFDDTNTSTAAKNHLKIPKMPSLSKKMTIGIKKSWVQ